MDLYVSGSGEYIMFRSGGTFDTELAPGASPGGIYTYRAASPGSSEAIMNLTYTAPGHAGEHYELLLIFNSPECGAWVGNQTYGGQSHLVSDGIFILR